MGTSDASPYTEAEEEYISRSTLFFTHYRFQNIECSLNVNMERSTRKILTMEQTYIAAR